MGSEDAERIGAHAGHEPVRRLPGRILVGKALARRAPHPTQRGFIGGNTWIAFVVLACAAALVVPALAAAIPDPRHIQNGWVIPSEGYADQPYIVKTDDGAWLRVMTTGIPPGSWREARSGRRRG
jgi:hypothetical protein